MKRNIMKTMFFLFFAVTTVGMVGMLTGCAREPVKLNCQYCAASGECRACGNSGNCAACGGSGECARCKGTADCQKCKGTGHEPAKCPRCKGFGFISPENLSDEPVPCRHCRASGEDPSGRKAPCVECVVHTDAFKQRVDANAFENAIAGNNYPEIQKLLSGISKGTGKCVRCEGDGKCVTCEGAKICQVCDGMKMCQNCKGHGFNIEIKACPNCHAHMPYNATVCPSCNTKIKYDKADLAPRQR